MALSIIVRKLNGTHGRELRALMHRRGWSGVVEAWYAAQCQARAAPSPGRQVQATFWDMHRFDADGRIVETWNLMDSLAILQQLGLVPTQPKK
jgi:hypothetical protein